MLRRSNRSNIVLHKQNKAIVDIRLHLHCAITLPPLQLKGCITWAHKCSEYYLHLPGVLNDPICCMNLLAIEWSLFPWMWQTLATHGVAWSLCHVCEHCENGWTERYVVLKRGWLIRAFGNMNYCHWLHLACNMQCVCYFMAKNSTHGKTGSLSVMLWSENVTQKKPGVVGHGRHGANYSSIIAAVESEHGLPTQTAAMLRNDWRPTHLYYWRLSLDESIHLHESDKTAMRQHFWSLIIIIIIIIVVITTL